MACNQWEEAGLLFSSNELSTSDAEAFTAHMKECNECTDEYSAYMSMKRQFFKGITIDEKTSEACDIEILRVCSRMIKPTATSFTSISLIAKRTFFSLALFIIGFISVSYISVRKNDNGIKQSVQDNSATTTTLVVSVDSVGESVADSIKDSLIENGTNYAKTRGNLDFKGVVPVELQK